MAKQCPISQNKCTETACAWWKGGYCAVLLNAVSLAKLADMKQKRAKPQAKGADTWLTPYGDAWKAAYGGEMMYAKESKPLRKLKDEHGDALTLKSWTNYLAETEARFASAAHMSKAFLTYAKGAPVKQDTLWEKKERYEAQRAIWDMKKNDRTWVLSDEGRALKASWQKLRGEIAGM